MTFGADQLEALAECVDLINTGRLAASAGVGGAAAGAGAAGAGAAGAGAGAAGAGAAGAGAGAAGAGPRAGAAGAGLSGAGHPGAGVAAPGPAVTDPLATLAGVTEFARRHRVENISAARRSDVARLADLRARLDAVAVACESGEEDVAIAGLNALLAETGAVPQIVEHDGRGPHLHVSRGSAPLADRIAAHCAMGLAELVVAGAASRMRTCAAPACQSVFVDLSRNQARRYCDSRTCGNRLHVAAYRSRKLAASHSVP